MAFSISAMIRSQPADYGFQLNEFDPFFNYRATKFIVDNGLPEYFSWHDNMSWYPTGRDVAATSQVMLHVTSAILYSAFGGGSDLYGFTIILPVVFGSLTTIVIFALVRVIGGTTAGLFASLLYAVSLPIITRGTIGWFKSEPLGLFYGILATYLFLSGIKSSSHKIAFAKLIGAGIFLGFAFSAWGGTDFFVLPLGLFILSLPFIRKDTNFLRWAIPVFVLGLAISLIPFERPGISFFTKTSGFMILGPTIFLVACSFIQTLSGEEKRRRNSALFLIAMIAAGIGILATNAFSLPSFRYLNAINPFLTTVDPLVDSVAEHATTSIFQSYLFNSVFMIFGGIGVWLIFKNILNSSNDKRDVHVFALIIGLLGVYISSAFIRLELYSSLSLVILGSVGLSMLTKQIFRQDVQEKKKLIRSHPKTLKISYSVMIAILLIIPLMIPVSANWTNAAKIPPTILNGGSNYNIATSDWLDAMQWLKENTSQDAVVASWWDYGYWITTLGERRSLADNATLIDSRIKLLAKMFLSNPDEAWDILQEMDADYVLVYIAAQRINSEEPPLYMVQGGGDESKKQWFMRIGGFPVEKYLYADGISPTQEFWSNTMLGKMIPYNTLAYVDIVNQKQSASFVSGFTPVYTYEMKFPENGNGPLRLAYISSSFSRTSAGPINGVLIYEVNKDYKPQTTTETMDTQKTETAQAESVIKSQIATISTNFGDIVIALKPEVAPKTVENFVKLANSQFYDGTLFHRIISDFMIQGGDPNTISGPPGTWGTGGPGYTIPAEISNLKHTKYMVSMARGQNIDSAGSQFFIMVGDAPWLDGQYTIFGEVIKGQEVVDQIASLQTNLNDQPLDWESARIKSITISSP
ncbi:MAG TPA: peptidylprolyl isomerase [Candidatus Nitrosotenuis sp.]|nr:peptidylprolyl isomerase [Candidatus Nitrosotenuis sp.]